MKPIILDQGLPSGSAILLRQAGFDAIHVREIGMKEAEDGQILDYAAGEFRVVITLDREPAAYLYDERGDYGLPCGLKLCWPLLTTMQDC